MFGRKLGDPRRLVRPVSVNWQKKDGIKLLSRFLFAVFLAGGGYLYSVNKTAVQGYQIRSLENEISKLKDQNAELRITEADLRSLYRIEETGERLEMQKVDTLKYLEVPGPVAYK